VPGLYFKVDLSEAHPYCLSTQLAHLLHAIHGIAHCPSLVEVRGKARHITGAYLTAKSPEAEQICLSDTQSSFANIS